VRTIQERDGSKNQLLTRAFFKGIFILSLFGSCVFVRGQSNVYSLAVYAGGTSWSDLCSLALPFPPYQFKLTQRSWREDADGLTIMDIRRQLEGVPRSLLEVHCGSNSFNVALNSLGQKGDGRGLASKGTKGSGDLGQLMAQCITNRAGHAVTYTGSPTLLSWVLHSCEFGDIIVVEGDRFTQVQKLLQLICGAPDTTIHASVPVGNGRSLTYAPQQIGVMLNLSADSQWTIVSIIGNRN